MAVIVTDSIPKPDHNVDTIPIPISMPFLRLNEKIKYKATANMIVIIVGNGSVKPFVNVCRYCFNRF